MMDTAVSVNGKDVELEASQSLAELLRRCDVDPAEVKGVAVAINEEVIRREKWQETIVQPGDRVEIVTAKLGG